MMLYLGADHGGYRAKVALKNYLTDQGYSVIDCGAITYDGDDDYPLYARAVAEKVSQDPTSLGILLCRSGQGMAMAANKFPRVRAALAWDEATASAARGDDDANILCLPADYLTEDQILEVVNTFVAEQPKIDPRYARRIREIHAIEEETMR
jgi:ribose 5-phosphate isomerase B